ncbi:MAG TPA: DUF1800 domain-containing protein [Jatrophihabitans sp.]|nr:DUF1800 domain-containing protein [Jatrophihabitans sp.]
MATTIWPSIAAAVQNAPRTAYAPMPWDPPSLLLARFGFGDSPAARADLAARGYDGWWAHQLAMPAGYAAHPAIAAHGTLLGLSPKDVRAWLKANGNEYGWQLMDQLTEVTLGLQTWSPAQLYESVVDALANHLNVANHSDGVWTTRHTMDRDVIRRHAFGSFTDLLLASARNPAMLQYLSLAQSTKTAVNENYGRELLELHTVGAGNYTEDDVKNSAKILTGRTLDADYNYLYNGKKHWTGPIAVMGFRHANATADGGEAAGDDYLRYLAAHPKTAQRLAQQLCVRFVSDTPTPGLVAAVAQAYSDSGTQLVPMLSTIVRSSEFWASRGAKVRRPLENLLATVRIFGYSTGTLATTLPGLHWMSSSVGQVPLDWSPPNGYPDVATAWRSSGSLLNLWEFHRGFAQSWWDGFDKLDLTTLYPSPAPATSGAAITALCVRLAGSPLPAAHRQALQTFLGEPASTPLAQSKLRWLLGHLVPLILDSPQFALR